MTIRTYERIPAHFQAVQFNGTNLTEELTQLIGERKAAITDGVLTVKGNSYPPTIRVVAGEWLIRTTREGSDGDETEGRLHTMNSADFKATYRLINNV